MKKKLKLNKESILRLETQSKVRGGLIRETEMSTCPTYRQDCLEPIVTYQCNTKEAMCPSGKATCAHTACANTCAVTCQPCIVWG